MSIHPSLSHTVSYSAPTPQSRWQKANHLPSRSLQSSGEDQAQPYHLVYVTHYISKVSHHFRDQWGLEKQGKAPWRWQNNSPISKDRWDFFGILYTHSIYLTGFWLLTHLSALRDCKTLEVNKHVLVFQMPHNSNFSGFLEENLSCNHSCHTEIWGKLLQEDAPKLTSKCVFKWTTGLSHCLRMLVSKEVLPQSWGPKAVWKEKRWVYLKRIQFKLQGPYKWWAACMGLFQGPVVNSVFWVLYFFSQRGSPKLYKPQVNLDSPLDKRNSIGLIWRKSRAFVRNIACTA